jgi:TPP-dependent indolepyruvate ferredoxin oxidoreductase alpha subunit
MPRPVVIDENICEGCGTCYAVFGCPAIGRKYNGQAFIHEDLCNGNGSCIQVCPVSAIVRPAPDDTPEDIARKYKNPAYQPNPAECAPEKAR